MRFRDREEAGRLLAGAVRRAGLGAADAVVLGLPRGGVPVASEVARDLGAPLDVIVVRKLGVPFQPELAMGAMGEGGVRVANMDVIRSTALFGFDLDAVERRERSELERRARRYREDRARIDLRGRRVLIVDDGIATGSSARAACMVARAQGSEHIVLAAPVASRPAVSALRDVCDELVCVEIPDPFHAVGEWYGDFSPTPDDEVVDLLRTARETGHATGTGPA
jgi:putative phosphoribosyl transferase